MDTWICPTCGNTNYEDEGEQGSCIGCNWSDYDKWADVPYAEAIKAPEWQGFGWECPVCGNKNAGEYPDYDVCPLCGWEDDDVQRDDPDYSGGANELCINDYKAEWEKKQESIA